MGSEDFTWHDLLVIVRHLPKDSALWRAKDPEGWDWKIQTHLLAAAVDALHWLQWAKTKGAQDGGDPPEPWPRPGTPDEEPEGMELDDMYALLAQKNGALEIESIH